jgi:hypothetical protein
VAIRAQVRKLGGQNLGLLLRDAGGWRCDAYFDGGKVFGMGQHKPRFVNFMGVVTPAEHNDFFEMTFAAVGDTLATFVDGEQVMEYRDPRPLKGGVGIAAVGGPVQFRRVEVQQLE